MNVYNFQIETMIHESGGISPLEMSSQGTLYAEIGLKTPENTGILACFSKWKLVTKYLRFLCISIIFRC